VQFHLGANHQIRRVTVAIHGSWRYTLIGNRRFHGTIGIDGPGEGNPYDYKHRALTMTLTPFGGMPMMWEGSQSTRVFIAGPTTTRAGGLRIANRVMRAFLGRTVLR
jgi:hypothetical protein